MGIYSYYKAKGGNDMATLIKVDKNASRRRRQSASTSER